MTPDDLTGDLAVRAAAYAASQRLFRAAQDVTSPDVPSAQVPLDALETDELLELLVILDSMMPITIDLLDDDQRSRIGKLLHQAGVRQVRRGDALLPGGGS